MTGAGRLTAIAALFVLAIGAALARRGLEAPDEDVVLVEEIMATTIAVRVAPRDADAARVVFDVFREVDATMSEWKPTSPLSRVNAAAGVEPVPVPDALRALIARGRRIGATTDGAFDITWAALWGLWDFNAPAPRVPEPGEIERRTTLVDARLVDIDDDAGTVYLPRAGMLIGLGGIAKGHALDCAAAALRARGVDRFLISAGGQVVAGGRREDGRPWRVGIRDPRGDPDDAFAFVAATNVSVATSGDYERYFVLDGVRYHHVLDPRTGRPCRGVRSATVVAVDATLADALSTALMILGPKRALALVEQMPGVDAVIVDAAAAVHVTSGLRRRLQITHPPVSGAGAP